MITLFTIPRACEGLFGIIQRNAIKSWCQLKPKPEIILCGTDAGTRDLCDELNLRHAPDISYSPYGRPLLGDVFREAHGMATHQILCYVNADIILLQDFMEVMNRVCQFPKPWLMICRRWDTHITQPISFDDPLWAEKLRQMKSNSPPPAWAFLPYAGTDLFAFTKGLYDTVLPFPHASGYSDAWLIWKARSRHATIWDASDVLSILHQAHPYPHSDSRQIEMKHSRKLSGGWLRLFRNTLACYRLTSTGSVPIPRWHNWPRTCIFILCYLEQRLIKNSHFSQKYSSQIKRFIERLFPSHHLDEKI